MTRRFMTRRFLAFLFAAPMTVSGFRFSKAYRHGVTVWHRLVYRYIDTVEANRLADL